MKKIVWSLAIVLIASVGINAQKLEFKNIKESTVDYGTIPQNANGDRVVQVKNTGDKPLIISNVQPTCGCTIANWTKTPIKPGGKGEIKIHYNTATVGDFTKQINVTTNDEKTPSTFIKIKGKVLAANAPVNAKNAPTTAVTAPKG